MTNTIATTTISQANKDYSNTPAAELTAAGNYGKAVHEAAALMAYQDWAPIQGHDIDYLGLAMLYIQDKMTANNLKAIDTEAYLTYKVDDFTKLTAQYDLYATNGKHKYLIDYKTEDKEDLEAWTLQLNIYKQALERIGDKVDELYVLRIPKKQRPQWVRIPVISETEIKTKIKAYDKNALKELVNNG